MTSIESVTLEVLSGMGRDMGGGASVYVELKGIRWDFSLADLARWREILSTEYEQKRLRNHPYMALDTSDETIGVGMARKVTA